MKINIKKLIPRFIKIKLNEVLGRVNQYKGNYLSWGEALSDSEGYDSVELLNRVIKGNELVLAGKATYERDGVLFDKVSYAMELNSCLLLAYCHTDPFNKFTVVDFGGSLGTVFRQFEEFTNFSLDFQWNIVEQKILFDYGVAHIQSEKLRFHLSTLDNFQELNPTIILFSSVLEFIEDFEVVLRRAQFSKSKYIVFDRLAVWSGHYNHISVLKAAKYITGSYPCWIFKENFLDEILVDYELVVSWPSSGAPFSFAGGNGRFIGMLWRRK